MAKTLIETLKPNQVFVFGTNEGGFHGAGAAGYAMRGDSRNNWRQDKDFLQAMNSREGDPARVGRWAVYGKARGPMMGRLGMGYGIVTIVKPGQRRSIPLHDIFDQLSDLSYFAAQNPHLEFLVTELGCNLAGYTREEIKKWCFDLVAWPPNVVLPEAFK